MSSVLQDVRTIALQLDALRATFLGSNIAPESVRCVGELLGALENEFDLAAQPHRGISSSASHSPAPSREVVLLKKRLSYQISARTLAEERLALGDKEAGRIRNVWFLRAGLSPPDVAPGKLEDFCRDFSIDHCLPIGRSSIDASRNAMCELVKGFNRQHVVGSVLSQICGSSQHEPLSICITHLHDEASFRMRSHAGGLPSSGLASSMGRARHSKVLNHVIDRHIGDEEIRWLTELQPLGKKDSACIAKGLMIPLQEFLATSKDSSPGPDGIPYSAWEMAGPAGLTTLESVSGDMRNEARAPAGFDHSLQAFATKKNLFLIIMV